VVHAAALKQVPAAEYNPFEFVKTNVMGAENVIGACIDQDVKHVVALSTDKAANPINLYGATKLCSDKLFVAGNSYSGGRHATRFSVVRYGNVVGSRGSVIPFFLRKRKEGVLPITDERMTRFWITLQQGAALVMNALRDMRGGEIWVPKIPSMRITDLARVIAPGVRTEVVGIRPGEKLHEVMIPVDDGRQAIEFDRHFIIKPSFPWWEESWHAEKGGKPCPAGFYYGSDNNTEWVDDKQLTSMIAALDLHEAKEWARERGVTAARNS
jgi:UDP-N-acetylglucosamine 4,6-dehydratase